MKTFGTTNAIQLNKSCEQTKNKMHLKPIDHRACVVRAPDPQKQQKNRFNGSVIGLATSIFFQCYR